MNGTNGIGAGARRTADPDPDRGSRRRLGFWVLVGVLAASGVAMAFIVLFGLAESQAFSLTWRIFVADIYLIASLAAQHEWLKRTIWAGTAFSFVFGVIVVFWPDQEYYRDWDVDYENLERTPFGVVSDIDTALHIVLVSLVLLGLLSLGYRFLRDERMLRIVYVAAFAAGLAAAAMWAIEAIAQSWLDYPLQLGISILALTAAAIVIIGALVQRKAWSERRGEEPDPGAAAQRYASAGVDDPELRALVRRYVDEYLQERGR